ncbi:MAG: hypothetical protein ACRDK3_08335 [Actinomycetota bacterium]
MPDKRSSTEAPTWLLVAPDTDLPPEWAERAIELLALPLVPREVTVLIERKRVHHTADPHFLHMVAQGLATRDIARALDITDRSVYRRLAALRGEFAVDTNAELTAQLARRGF